MHTLNLYPQVVCGPFANLGKTVCSSEAVNVMHGDQCQGDRAHRKDEEMRHVEGTDHTRVQDLVSSVGILLTARTVFSHETALAAYSMTTQDPRLHRTYCTF